MFCNEFFDPFYSHYTSHRGGLKNGYVVFCLPNNGILIFRAWPKNRYIYIWTHIVGSRIIGSRILDQTYLDHTYLNTLTSTYEYEPSIHRICFSDYGSPGRDNTGHYTQSHSSPRHGNPSHGNPHHSNPGHGNPRHEDSHSTWYPRAWVQNRGGLAKFASSKRHTPPFRR